MNFGNLTNQQNRWLFRSITKYMSQLKDEALRGNVELNDMELFKIFTLYFINLPNVGRNEAFNAFMQVFYRGDNRDNVIPALQIMINGWNLAGRVLRAWKASEDTINGDTLMISAQENLSKPLKEGCLTELVEALFGQGLQ